MCWKEMDQIKISLRCNETLLFGAPANHAAAQIAQKKKKKKGAMAGGKKGD